MLVFQAGFQVLATDGILAQGLFGDTSRGTVGPCDCARIHRLGTGQRLLCSAVFYLGTQRSRGKGQEGKANEEFEAPASGRPDIFSPFRSSDIADYHPRGEKKTYVLLILGKALYF